ncbi:MAG: RNA polymerase sigma factor [Pseudomonadota bacterium]
MGDGQQRGVKMVDRPEASDTDLIEKIKAGDKFAMRLLYERHSAGLGAFIRRRLNDPVEAADVVHDTFLDVWTKAASFQGRSSVKSWMYSIARNKSVDRIRKLSPVLTAEADETVPDDTPLPDAIIENSQDAERVRLCVEALSDVQRTAVMLAFYEDMTYKEIAIAEDVSEGTIKTRIFHAKKLLMRCLSRDKPG